MLRFPMWIERYRLLERLDRLEMATVERVAMSRLAQFENRQSSIVGRNLRKMFQCLFAKIHQIGLIGFECYSSQSICGAHRLDLGRICR